MRVEKEASPVEIAGLGIALAAGGGYFILVALGVLPEPSGNVANAPAAIFCAVGLSFLLAGLICVVRAKAGMTGAQDDVPANAPDWLKTSYRALAIGVAGSLALVGTWVAIGSGPRTFTVASPAGEMQTTGELLGRTVFALGTVIVWIYVIALTVQTVRKLFGR